MILFSLEWLRIAFFVLAQQKSFFVQILLETFFLMQGVLIPSSLQEVLVT